MTRSGAVLLTALLCLALGYVLGRRAEPAYAAPPTHLELLARDLELRPDQKAAIGRLLADQDRDLQSLVEAARDGLAEPTASRLQRTEDEMLTLLDADQRERYQSLAAVSSVDAR
jgi:hypothetical protein